MVSPIGQPKFEICNIGKLKKMTCMWWKCNRASSGRRNPPSDVPPGHLAVLVGISRRRLVIKAEHLNHPIFRWLLDQAFEECSHQRDGPLALPCDESFFREVVGLIECGANAHPSLCHVEEKVEDLAPLICGSMRRSACQRKLSYPRQ